MILQWLNKKLKQLEKRQQSYHFLLDHMELINDMRLTLDPKVYLKMRKVIFYLKYGRFLKGIRRKIVFEIQNIEKKYGLYQPEEWDKIQNFI